MPLGAMIISFDLEMAWGLRLSNTSRSRFPGAERVRDVVAALSDVFVKYDISATWATVGHLMLAPEDCPGGRFNYNLPAPRHEWFPRAWYDDIPATCEPDAPQYYAPDIIDRLVSSAVYQEIGSHTFSHPVIDDAGCSAEVARAEFAKCQELARHWGRELKSVVFPRNLAGHLEVLEETGYLCYRALNSEWYWFSQARHLVASKRLRRFVAPFRLLDERLRFTPPLPPVRRVGRLWEIPHSMFFPGFHGVSKYVTAEDRIRRAQRGIQAAADRGRIFSMWAHPHNFLPNPDNLLSAFESICRFAALRRDAGELAILTMGQVAEELDAGRNRHWAELN